MKFGSNLINIQSWDRVLCEMFDISLKSTLLNFFVSVGW